jgi:polar amino acid transport system permease protein
MWSHLPEIARALPLTVCVTVAAALLAAGIALTAGALRLSPVLPLRLLSGAYIEFFRGTSLLVQIFWFFFVLPLFGLPLSPLQAGVAALALNLGAYGAEVVRGSLLAVPRSQVEAGIALNLTAWQRFRVILVPQALPLMLPQAGNLTISLLKATSLLSLVTISEITARAQAIRERTGDEQGVYLALLLCYFTLSLGIAAVVRGAERLATRHLSRTVRPAAGMPGENGL